MIIDLTGYYLNPNIDPQQNIELGTEAYPFRMLDDTFREVFNQAA